MNKEQVPRRIQNIHGVDYIYEDFASWDKTKKNATHARRYIGKMVDNVFVPNKKFFLSVNLKLQRKRNQALFPQH